MLRSLKLYYIFLFFFFTLLVDAQEEPQTAKSDESIDIKLETAGVFTNGDFAPFWITNNNNGLGSINTDNQYLRAGIFSNKDIFNDKVHISVGLDMIASRNLHSDFFLHQVYTDLKYKIWVMSIGAKERFHPLKNIQLSTGGLTLSNNARPIPQVEFGIPEFVDMPFTNDLVQVQAGLSYGLFGDDLFKRQNAADGNYAQKVLYHRKYAFFKFERNSPSSFIFGLEMDTQWGGRIYKNGEYFTSSPAKFFDFFRILMPMSGGSKSNGTDQVNILGNVYGSWHFVYTYSKENYSIRTYHEHFFEDHSGLIFKNIPDGAYGLELNFKKNRYISSILFEYIHTKNQSGPFLYDQSEEIPIQVSAGDNYYNHIDYVSLSHYGFVMGNPLLTSPIYNEGRSLTVFNNRISAFHVGVAGSFSNEWLYRLLLTHSQSWGTHLFPAKDIRSQFSSFLETTYSPDKFKGWQFAGALSYDRSATMIGNNLGFRLKISKALSIK